MCHEQFLQKTLRFSQHEFIHKIQSLLLFVSFSGNNTIFTAVSYTKFTCLLQFLRTQNCFHSTVHTLHVVICDCSLERSTVVTALVLPEVMADDSITLLLLTFVKRTGTTNILAQTICLILERIFKL